MSWQLLEADRDTEALYGGGGIWVLPGYAGLFGKGSLLLGTGSLYNIQTNAGDQGLGSRVLGFRALGWVARPYKAAGLLNRSNRRVL